MSNDKPEITLAECKEAPIAAYKRKDIRIIVDTKYWNWLLEIAESYPCKNPRCEYGKVWTGIDEMPHENCDRCGGSGKEYRE